MPNNEPAKYSSTQQELYSISELAYNNCIAHLADFASFSPLYTADYCAQCKTEVEAAMLMPSDTARSGLSEDNRILLTRAADEGVQKWRGLKRYITSAYDNERSETMLKIAGQAYYAEASHYSWQKVSSLLKEGSAFIATHLADLFANNNMPPNFGAEFDATKDSFETLKTKFLGGVAATSIDTQNKIRANNAVFAKLTKMLNDGQHIFEKDEAIRQKFIFINLKSIVSGVNAAGIRGFVTAIDTGLPIVGATVATANNIYTAVTDVEGRFDLKGMAANDYVLTIIAAGYVTQTLPLTVKTGTVSTLDAVMALEVKNV